MAGFLIESNRPGRMWRVPGQLLLSAAFALNWQCRRDHPPSGQTPAASASVVTLAFGINTCEDIAGCERDCDAGIADRCRSLGAAFAFGRGVERDEARATTLYESACRYSDPTACVFAGQMHEFARGVAKNDAAAVELYRRACDLQWAPGCYNLAIMYERGTGVPAERAKAGELYAVACRAGAKGACSKAEEMTRLPGDTKY